MNRCREKFHGAFLDLLKEKSFEKITIKEIVARAGVSRNSYYRHYYTQRDLLNEILDDFFVELDWISQRMGAAFSFSPVTDRKYSAGVYQMILCYYHNAPTLKIILESDAGAVLEERMHHYIAPCFSAWLADAFDQSERYTQSQFFEGINRFNTAGFVRIICDWIKSDCAVPPEQVLDFTLRISNLTAIYIKETKDRTDAF